MKDINNYRKPTVSICDDLRKGGFVVRMGRAVMSRTKDPVTALQWGKWLAEEYELPLRLRVRNFEAFSFIEAQEIEK